MASLDKDQVIDKFTLAYTNANGKAPTIEAKGGWYSVDGGKNVRLAQLDELADEMSGDGAAKAEVKKPTKAAKPAAAKAKADTKPKAKKAKPQKAKGGFSVKSHWNEKIKADNSGAILPR